LQILATSSSPKDESKNGREQDGRDGRVRRNLGRVTVAKELVKNEEGRAFIYTWESKSDPSWMNSKCHSPTKTANLKGGALLGFWEVRGVRDDEGASTLLDQPNSELDI
jgi:hypothetical protein